MQLRHVLFLFLLYSPSAYSTERDSNVVITESKELHEFIWQRNKNTVQVKQSITTSYYCNYFATILPITEWYDNEMSIDAIDFSVNRKKINYIKPQYSYYESDGIFFSDQRICFFKLPLEEKGSTGTVSFRKTISDPRYFSTIYFSGHYPVLHKEVTIIVPRWMKVELKEMNFAGFRITKQLVYNEAVDADVYTYIIANLPSISSEDNAPGASFTEPHILVLPKEAIIHNNRKVYFNTLADQYAWYHTLVENIGSDSTVVKTTALQITKGATNDLEKIKTIFYWVQNNIRYVAFENGMAGFKPDKADEVIRKKYGDCKGMANVTKELLKSLGFDARLCWIGTNDIAYDYSTPSLAVDNHMICALKWKDSLIFLDATETYLAFNEYAERIQGRQCLVEDEGKYILTHIPASTTEQNLDEEIRMVSITGTDFKGTVSHLWKGEEKEDILMHWNNTKKDKSTESFTRYLSNNKPDYAITGFKTSDVLNFDQPLTASYSFHHKNAVSIFGEEYYINLDFEKEFDHFTIDPALRNLDYWFLSKMNISRQTELIIPAGYRLKSIPPNLEINNDHYKFSITYTSLGDKIIYRKWLIIKDIKLKKELFVEWNKNIQRLTASYNEQIVLTSK